MTPEEIAKKYVHGLHDALTDSQEKKDMVNDMKDYAEEYHQSKLKLLGNTTEKTNMNTEQTWAFFPVFFTILWIVATLLCITFFVKGLIIEMWIANAFMWIGVFGRSWSKNQFCA